MTGGRLLDVLIKRIYWENFGVLDKGPLMEGGRLRVVVAHRGSTVLLWSDSFVLVCFYEMITKLWFWLKQKFFL